MHAIPRKILVLVGAAAGLTLAVAGPAAGHRTASPQNTSLPSISGSARDGSALLAAKGGWANSPTSYAYQWQRCDSSGGSCVAIAGATGTRYTLVGTDVGRRITVGVTATNTSGSGTATSRPTDVVKSTGTAPADTSPPAISGTFKEGNTLTVAPGSWSGSPTPAFTYQWQRCDATGGACADLTGSSATTYGAVAADVGTTLRVKVTGTNSHGSTLATTTETVMIVPAAAGGGKAISVAQVSLPNRLVVDNLKFTPSRLSSRGSFVARFHVSDTRGFSIQGALVYALVVPYSWSRSAQETTTDASGWASITIQPTSVMPLTRGTSVVIFVRARKSGDDLLAGVSTRRLVQVLVRP
ncbi:MAG TPA: hypothetical protein VKC62_09515 [Gaiellaceae bacterium]|nr:hypothetical protein [Gaiellaceae bacterium]